MVWIGVYFYLYLKYVLFYEKKYINWYNNMNYKLLDMGFLFIVIVNMKIKIKNKILLKGFN